MLRYNKGTQYRTVTGGIVTLGIMIMVIIGFFSMISKTMNKTAIDSTTTMITSNNPPEYNLTANKNNMFMFGLQITSQDLSFFYDMNGPQRYFDITLEDFVIKYGIIDSITPRSMVPCTD